MKAHKVEFWVSSADEVHDIICLLSASYPSEPFEEKKREWIKKFREIHKDLVFEENRSTKNQE
jgi:hypothetical protein